MIYSIVVMALLSGHAPVMLDQFVLNDFVTTDETVTVLSCIHAAGTVLNTQHEQYQIEKSNPDVELLVLCEENK